MATTSQTLILKVLSGSQFGVEVSLQDGEYSFGSGPDCDIQFSDIAMAAHHGTLRIAGGKPELKAVGAQLHTASGLVIEDGQDDWREIAQLDKITAGTSIFAIGTADADWSKLTQIKSADTSKQMSLSKPNGSMSTVMIAGAVIAVCILGIIFLTGSGGNLPLVKKSTPSEDFKIVENAISSLPFATNLDLELQPDGVINITGYVKDGAERRAVQNAVLDTGAPIRRRIWALEALRTDVSGLIESQRIDIDYELTQNGMLSLSGTHLDVASVDQTVQLLETEVFGLSGVENNILTAQTYLQRVELLIGRLQLSELVLARLDGNLIETTGIVPVERTDNWVGFMRTYSRQFADIIPLRSFVTLEGETNSAPTEPVILGGGSEQDVLTGRVLPTDLLEDDQNTDPTALFATSSEGAANSANFNAVNGNAAFSEIIDGLVSNNSQIVNGAINSFVDSNPDVVASLLRNLTNGQVDDVETLRNLFGGSTAAAPRRTSNSSSSSTTNFSLGTAPFEAENSQVADQIVELLNNAEAAPFVSLVTPAGTENGNGNGNDDVGGTGSNTTTVTTSQESPTASSNVDLSGFLPVPTFFQGDRTLSRLNVATEALFDTSNSSNPRPHDGALTLNPRLAEISPELVALAMAQKDALSSGETLLTSPGALSALPNLSPNGKTCWRGSSLTVESLPSVLLWMDILSTSENLDVMQLEDGSRQLFIEATLNPNRINNCLSQIDSKFSRQLKRSSVFLDESKRNTTFAAFLLRGVPRFSLNAVGTNLTETRYIHLEDGRKLREGAAPDLGSRISNIGDLGLMIRVPQGFRVYLYDDELSWIVADVTE